MVNDLYFCSDLLLLLQILDILNINITKSNLQLKRNIPAQFLSNQISLNNIGINLIHLLFQFLLIFLSKILQIFLLKLLLPLLLHFYLLLIFIIEFFLIIFELLYLILYDIIINGWAIRYFILQLLHLVFMLFLHLFYLRLILFFYSLNMIVDFNVLLLGFNVLFWCYFYFQNMSGYFHVTFLPFNVFFAFEASWTTVFWWISKYKYSIKTNSNPIPIMEFLFTLHSLSI